MMPNIINPDVEQRRLAWRCRRGMLELDIVLQRFVEKHFDTLAPAEMQAFNMLLALPDNDFWTLLATPTSNLDQSTQAILAKMTI